MDAKYCHEEREVADHVEPSTSMGNGAVHNLEGVVAEETNDIAKRNETGVNAKKMNVEPEAACEHETEANLSQEQIGESPIDNKCDVVDKTSINEENGNKDILTDASCTDVHSVASSEVTTLQDSTPVSQNDVQSSSHCSEQNKIKRSISKGQMNGDSGISTERSGYSSEEDSSKRQKLNESTRNRSKPEDENAENAAKFHKLNSKVKKRNYRSKKPSKGETAAESCNDGEGTEDVEMRQEADGDDTVSKTTEYRERGVEIHSDDPDAEDAASEEYSEEEEEGTPICLRKEKPKPNWFVVPELMRREMGNNPLFQHRYYGSLHVVEHFELMYKLQEHQGCVNALTFNQKGNLLASVSDDLAVVIWDWAAGKKNHSFKSGHRSNIFQAKWLPFEVQNLIATCARDGQVRLSDVRRGISRKIATHYAPTHKLAVHPDTPHVIISVGEDARVLSIDIREDKPTKLLVVKDSVCNVQLYSVHSNPLNSNEFCIAGRSPAVRVYDRRKVSTPLYELYPNHLVENKHVHVTCAVYNYNGTEVLASYNDEDIYLFDTVMPEAGDFAHRYQGHRNSATVKGVNFFGPKSEFVVSGSDCGNIFIWDKNTEAIVNCMAGDEQGVVNCLEPHPHVPILATSGLDFDVKIWVPSCEQPPYLTNLENCVKSNAFNRDLDADNTYDSYVGQMLWLLSRHIRHTGRVRNLNDDDNADDSSDDNDFSDLSDSQSEGDRVRTLQCPPS